MTDTPLAALAFALAPRDVGGEMATSPTHSKHRLTAVIAGAGWCLMLAVAARAQSDVPSSPDGAAAASHFRMLRLLQTVSEQTDTTNPFLGDAQAKLLREKVATFGPATPAAARFDGHMRLGLEELNLGNERVAIEQLRAAREWFTKSGLPPDVYGQALYFSAVAWLRLGETENCCRQPGPDRCVFPIRGGGVHSETEGSTRAITFLNKLLAMPGAPEEARAEAAWMLNIAHMTLGTWPDGVDPRWRIRLPKDENNREPFPRFPNLAADRGLAHFSLAGGAAADDFDGDGDLDLFVSCWDPRVAIRFLQQQSDGTFADRSESANLAGLFGGLNLLQADYDNDGDLDVLVLRGAWLKKEGQHPNSLLRNEGPGPGGVPRFVDVTFLTGLGETHRPTQTAAWADYDLDGDLDLFIGNETTSGQMFACQLFRNENGVFTDVAAAAGVENFGFTKGCSWGDYDGDGDPDLYVTNFSGPNRLYRNLGNGSFIDVAANLGVEGPARAFPVWFWDFNNDGALDLFASNSTKGGQVYWPYYRGTPLPDSYLAALYAGDGAGGFHDVARQSGLDVPMLPMGSNFGDLNNDGFPDMYLGTGTPNYADVVPNQLFVNRRGKRFSDETIASGMGHLQKGHGIAFADFDGDGDLDVFEQMGGALPGDSYYDALYENPGFPGTHWLQVRLKGVQSNRFGVGSRIRAVIVEKDGTQRSVYAHVNSGGSFGANPLTQHLGLGSASVVKRLEIFWPVTGKTQVLESVPADQRIAVTEGGESWEKF